MRWLQTARPDMCPPFRASVCMCMCVWWSQMLALPACGTLAGPASSRGAGLRCFRSPWLSWPLPASGSGTDPDTLLAIAPSSSEPPVQPQHDLRWGWTVLLVSSPSYGIMVTRQQMWLQHDTHGIWVIVLNSVRCPSKVVVLSCMMHVKTTILTGHHTEFSARSSRVRGPHLAPSARAWR